MCRKRGASDRCLSVVNRPPHTARAWSQMSIHSTPNCPVGVRQVSSHLGIGVLVAIVLVVAGSCGSNKQSNTNRSTSTTNPTGTADGQTSAPSSSTAPSSTSSTTGSSTTTTGPSTTTVAPGCDTLLKQGCTGEDVRKLQQLLSERGYSTAGIDGQFGPRTERGLQAFEATCDNCTRDKQIQIDGPEWSTLVALPIIPPTTRTTQRQPSR
jgi:Putative peptidoglycan binding domain